MNTIPCYKAVIDLNEWETGVYRVSLVENPAVEVNWQLFSKETEKLSFSIEDEEKHLVSGVIMKADTPFYRKKDGYDFYITFDKETIRVMAEKMLLAGNQNRVNADHDKDTFIPGMNLQEIYFKDAEKGISPKGFEDVPDGSLFATYKVHNIEVWDEIKKGTWKGFSVECLAKMELIEPEDEEEKEVLSLLDKLTNKLKNN